MIYLNNNWLTTKHITQPHRVQISLIHEVLIIVKLRFDYLHYCCIKTYLIKIFAVLLKFQAFIQIEYIIYKLDTQDMIYNVLIS